MISATAATLHRGVPANASPPPTAAGAGHDRLRPADGAVRRPRGLAGDYPADYDDENQPYTPAWQEKYTGIGRETVDPLRARVGPRRPSRPAASALIIIGAGSQPLVPQQPDVSRGHHALMFCGCVGVNGGGLAHYVGQEKLAPLAPWSAIALASDWIRPSRLQNAPSWHYVHTDQWRYDRDFTDYHTCRRTVATDRSTASGHTMDLQVTGGAQRLAAVLPAVQPQPARRRQRGAKRRWRRPDARHRDWSASSKSGKLKFAVEDPDAAGELAARLVHLARQRAHGQRQGPRVLPEALPRHAPQRHRRRDRPRTRSRTWTGTTRRPGKDGPGRRSQLPDGHLGAVLGHRAAGGDLVRKGRPQLDRHALLHSPAVSRGAAVLGVEERLGDLQDDREEGHRAGGEAFSRAGEGPGRRAAAARHPGRDRPARASRTGSGASASAIPGKTMPDLKVVERDYTNLYNRFISLGRWFARTASGAHGTHYRVADSTTQPAYAGATESWDGKTYPSLADDVNVCDVILQLATETNGELAYRAYKNLEEKVGLPLAHLAEKNRDTRVSYDESAEPAAPLHQQSDLVGLDRKRPRLFALHLQRRALVPWRTLTGRQHFYLDHPAISTSASTCRPTSRSRCRRSTPTCSSSKEAGPTLMLNYLTPHGKWHIHSTYGDNQRMMTLSRGVRAVLDERSGRRRDSDIEDNDWVEVLQRQRRGRDARGGQRAHSARHLHPIPRARAHLFGAEVAAAGQRRAGGHNSLTRMRLKPNLMVGGYAQFTYHFNYWGPTGVQPRHARAGAEASRVELVTEPRT